MEFGDIMSKLRKEKNLSQQELASRLNISKSSLAMYETNKRQPNFDLVKKIADFFDVTTDYLLGRVDERDTYISIAFEDGGEEPLSEDEKEHLEEMLKNFRETKKRWLKARGLPEED